MVWVSSTLGSTEIINITLFISELMVQRSSEVLFEGRWISLISSEMMFYLSPKRLHNFWLYLNPSLFYLYYSIVKLRSDDSWCPEDICCF